MGVSDALSEESPTLGANLLPPELLVVKLRPLWVPVIGAMSLIVPGSGTLTRLKNRALTC
jgi:hypothetical protein